MSSLPKREPAGHARQGTHLLKPSSGARLPELQRQHREIEHEVGALTYSRTVIPGPLQTQEYAEAVITAACHARGMVPSCAAETARIRMDRVAALHAHPELYVMLLDAAALTTLVGAPAIMRTQLCVLAQDIAQLPERTIGIIPVAAKQPLANHDFTVHLEREVSIEFVHAEIELEDNDSLRIYENLFEKLAHAAIYGQQAIDLITSISRRHCS